MQIAKPPRPYYTKLMRKWRDLLGCLGCVLGFLLVAQLAHAVDRCTSRSGIEALASSVAIEQLGDASCAPAACVLVANRNAVAVAASASSPDPSPAAVAAIRAGCLLPAAAEPQITSGLAPGFQSPPHILFRRFLS